MPILPRTLFTPDDDEAISVYELFSWDLPGMRSNFRVPKVRKSQICIPTVYKTSKK